MSDQAAAPLTPKELTALKLRLYDAIVRDPDLWALDLRIAWVLRSKYLNSESLVACPSAETLYQGALIMTHRDGFPRSSARSAWRSDAGHRKPCAPSESHGPSESLGKLPFRSGGRIGGGVGKP